MKLSPLIVGLLTALAVVECTYVETWTDAEEFGKEEGARGWW
jgi:hypothetical protein